jgi:hypothetical protein
MIDAKFIRQRMFDKMTDDDMEVVKIIDDALRAHLESDEMEFFIEVPLEVTSTVLHYIEEYGYDVCTYDGTTMIYW